MAFTAIGQPQGQIGGPDKVTGRTKYTDDIRLEGTLWGKCVRSPYAHARIVSVDTSRALAMPGVHAVISGQDIPVCLVGRALRDLPALAKDTVRFIGERVAAVAADTPEIAEAAALAVDVEYEELPAIFDMNEAMAPDAPILHPGYASYDGVPMPIPSEPNTMSHRVWSLGEVEEGFKKADHIIQRRYTVPRQHQGYLEPMACLVKTNPDGSAEMWATTKTPFNARAHLAAGLGIEPEKLLVHVGPVGGDFGAKGSVMDLPVAYFLSQRSGRPVRMLMSYVEELTAASTRHHAIITMKTGVMNDGTIVAHQVRALFDSGAYAAFKPSPLLDLNGASKLCGPYRMGSIQVDAFLVYTNQVPGGHMRSPGLPQAAFALESHLDVLAREIGLDPLDFRLKNVIRPGDVTPVGNKWEAVRAYETLEEAARMSGWRDPKPEGVGRGIALAEHGTGTGLGHIEVLIDRQGLTIRTAVPDTGTGSHTILQQVVAERTGLPLSAVRLELATTDELPFDVGVGGSRVTHVYGRAAMQAAEMVMEQARDRAAAHFGRDRELIRWENGRLVSDDGASVAAAELADEPMAAIARYTGQGIVETTSFCAQVAEVEVDKETGKVTVRKIYSANDSGTVLNPIGFFGQIAGGVIQGFGYAIMEDLPVSDGVVATQSLGDYKLPSMGDIPELAVEVVPTIIGPAPYDARSIGETPNVPTAPAIANAVADAIGVRIYELPVSAERVFNALKQPHHQH